MLDFFFQLAGMGLGYTLGSWVLCAVSMRIESLFAGAENSINSEKKSPTLSWDPLAILALLLTGVTWPTYPKEAKKHHETLALVFLFVLPPLILLITALLCTLLLKATLGLTLWALLLETSIRVFLTLFIVSFLPLPPLPGWHLVTHLLGRTGNDTYAWLLPALVFGFFGLELLTKFVILDLFFGRLTDALLQYLYLVG